MTGETQPEAHLLIVTQGEQTRVVEAKRNTLAKIPHSNISVHFFPPSDSFYLFLLRLRVSSVHWLSDVHGAVGGLLLVDRSIGLLLDEVGTIRGIDGLSHNDSVAAAAVVAASAERETEDADAADN